MAYSVTTYAASAHAAASLAATLHLPTMVQCREQVRKQDDPEELGRQAARYFERMRGQQACDVALREIRLHRPSRQPVNITISADYNQQVFNMKEHTFIAGNSEVRPR